MLTDNKSIIFHRWFWSGLRTFIRAMSSWKWGHECWMYLMGFHSSELQAACNICSSPGVPSISSHPEATLWWEAGLGLLGQAGGSPGTLTQTGTHTLSNCCCEMWHTNTLISRGRICKKIRKCICCESMKTLIGGSLSSLPPNFHWFVFFLYVLTAKLRVFSFSLPKKYFFLTQERTVK